MEVAYQAICEEAELFKTLNIVELTHCPIDRTFGHSTSYKGRLVIRLMEMCISLRVLSQWTC